MPPLFSKKTPSEAPAGSGLKSFLRKDLELTRERWSGALELLRARPKIDENLYEALESQLLSADVGVAATASLIGSLRKAQRDKRLEDALIRTAELVAEDHRDAEHELDLLLEREQGLTRDGSDGEHRAQPGRDRDSPADRAGRGDAPPCGTDELMGQLVIRVQRMVCTEPVDLGADPGLTGFQGVVQRPQDGAQLRREVVQGHRPNCTGGFQVRGSRRYGRSI